VCILCKFTQSFGNIVDNVGNVINILNTIITYLTLLMFIVQKRNTYFLKVLIFFIYVLFLCVLVIWNEQIFQLCSSLSIV
jgi:hypothetical protein